MAPKCKQPVGPPMTLANTRGLGVQRRIASCHGLRQNFKLASNADNQAPLGAGRPSPRLARATDHHQARREVSPRAVGGSCWKRNRCGCPSGAPAYSTHARATGRKGKMDEFRGANRRGSTAKTCPSLNSQRLVVHPGEVRAAPIQFSHISRGWHWISPRPTEKIAVRPTNERRGEESCRRFQSQRTE